MPSLTSRPPRYNIPPGPKSRKILEDAKTEIGNALPDEALRLLSDLKLPMLSTEVDHLSGRLSEYLRIRRLSIEAPDVETRTLNRINRDILDLITALQKELSTSTGNYDTIRDYLKKRYTNRLDQKLAKRQPVNLRRLVNVDVVPEDFHAAFVPYSSEEISGAMLQTYREAHGRLLLVGAPGAGKTTLMLQLVLELLESETDALPVLLNLATWSKEFITLETWLKKILPAEIGVSDRYGAEMLQQNNLILLFDGFDEIQEEDRLSCLEAINRYASDGQPYVISSRKQEFKDINKGMLIHLPVEVCPLTFDQLKAELLRLRNDATRPERAATLLLGAIEKDLLLREAVRAPFYFNTLQILFNVGVGVSDFQFKSNTVEGIQVEIKQYFVKYETKFYVQHQFSAKDAQHWLSFLSSRMTKRNMVIFELKDLQYDWWKWTRVGLIPARLVYGVVFGLAFGVVFGLISGLTFGLTFGLIHERVSELILGLLFGMVFGMLVGLLVGLTFGLTFGQASGLVDMLVDRPPQIETKDSIDWSRKKLMQILRTKLAFRLAFSLFLGLLIALFLWQALDINCGLGVALTYGLNIGLVIGLVIGLLELLQSSADILQITSPYHRFNASKKAFHFSILQHRLLCYQLRKRNLLPRDLPQFLNEMSLRHIMEFDGDPKTGTGGGSWRFRHRILQEYFAERWVEEEAESKVSKAT